MAKILAFSGSARQGSYNQALVAVAAEGARSAGAEVTLINLADYDMPLYRHEIEAAGFPETVLAFKALLRSHDGLLIASPEYNGSYTPLLKNALDWASRSEAGEATYAVFKEKVAGVMAASPNSLGGIRSLAALRPLLEHLGVMVLPAQRGIRSADTAFDAAGNLLNERDRKAVEAIGAQLAVMLERLGGDND